MNTYPISIQLFSLRDFMKEDVEATIRKVADIGFFAVEPAGLFGMDAASFRELVESTGMIIGSSHNPWASKEPLEEVVSTLEILDLKAAAGGFLADSFENLEAIRKVALHTKNVAEALRSRGYSHFIHNHAWEYQKIDGRLAIEHFLDVCPDIDFEFDIYWASAFGQNDVPALVDRYKKKIPLMHVKDGPLVKGEPMTALGEGRIDIKACIEAADPSVLQYLIFELDRCATDPWEATRKSFKFLVDSGLGHGR